MKPKISTIEVAFIVAISLITVFGLTKSVGGPMFSDELAYITPGINGTENLGIMNRYFHVYIQAFFMQLAPTPITGVRLFWSSEMVLTALMIYFGIRLLNKKATAIHSLVGGIFFFSLNFFLIYAGVTLIDFTSMILVTSILFLYLLSLRFERGTRWFVLGMGAILFFSYETKEVNLVVGLVAIGFGLNGKGEFHWNLLWQKLRWFILGIPCGIIVFMILSGVVVHDIFWALRPSEYILYSHGYASLYLGEHQPYDYLRALVDMLPLFMLFLIAGFKNGIGIGSREKIIWYFPFVLVIEISMIWIYSPYGTLPRLLYSALPVMCMFVPQILHYDFPAKRTQRVHLIIAILIGLLLIAGMVMAFPYISRAIGWDYSDFAHSLLIDVIFSGVMILLASIRKYGQYSFALALCGVVLLVAEPMRTNYIDVVVNRSNQKLYIDRISPFSSFKSSIHYSPSMQMLVSSNLSHSYGILAAQLDDLVGLFDLYFDEPAERNNFKVVDDNSDLVTHILENSFNYVLMSNEDWDYISQQSNEVFSIKALYKIRSDKSGRIYFLEKN
jgi:hypothetical protein